ncbi:hypothetical protein WME76_48190 (plasmid) [Sorangium sp. So ce119]|uniref:tetratricopeptide repeat protein n=1 Tax=Sorangium sp. So ce119 TaxID=3133279 RepID=UPI003F639A21
MTNINEISPQRAESLRTSGLYSDSVDCFSKWLEAHPKDAWSLAHCGAAKAALGDHVGAIKDLDEAINIKNLKKQHYPWASAQRGEAYRIYVRDGIPWTRDRLQELKANIQLSLDSFQTSTEQAPNYTWAFAHKGAMHALAYILIKLYPELGDHPHDHARDAEQCFDAATNLNPSYAWAFAFKSVFYGIVGRFNDATKVMGEALMMSTNSKVPSHRAFAELGYWDKHYRHSLTQGWLARQADPEDAIVPYYIAQSLNAINDPNAKAALDYARRRLSTLLNIVHMLLAGVYYAQGSHPEAKEMLEFLLGKQDLESMFIAQNDPIWHNVPSGSDLGKVLRALLQGANSYTHGDDQ